MLRFQIQLYIRSKNLIKSGEKSYIKINGILSEPGISLLHFLIENKIYSIISSALKYNFIYSETSIYDVFDVEPDPCFHILLK